MSNFNLVTEDETWEKAGQSQRILITRALSPQPSNPFPARLALGQEAASAASGSEESTKSSTSIQLLVDVEKHRQWPTRQCRASTQGARRMSAGVT